MCFISFRACCATSGAALVAVLSINRLLAPPLSVLNAVVIAVTEVPHDVRICSHLFRCARRHRLLGNH